MNSENFNDEIIDAIWTGNFNKFTDLIKNGGNVNFIFDQTNGKTILMVCCQYDLVAFVDFLLKNGANHRAIDLFGNRALHDAAYSSSAELVDCIIKYDQDEVNVKNFSGQTPLMLASKRCYMDAMHIILNNNGNPNCTDEDGSTALHYVFMDGGISKVEMMNAFDLLCKYNADKEIKNSLGLTPKEYGEMILGNGKRRD